MKSFLPVPLVIVLLALAVSGCGDRGPVPDPVPGEPPTESPVEKPAITQTKKPISEDYSLGDTHTRPVDGMVMVYVPGGEFEMGSDAEAMKNTLELCNAHYDDCTRGDYTDELPAHLVALDSFGIDRTEVTNRQYRQCMEAGACEPQEPTELDNSNISDTYVSDSAYDDYPVIFATWLQATAYCEWAGARLPTEAEWEYAARGPEGNLFPWGNTFDGTKLNYCDTNCARDHADKSTDDGYAEAAPVGTYPDGASWCGAWDMAGNDWEWAADWYVAWYYGSSPSENPTGPSNGRIRVVRGGGWFIGPHYARSTFRYGSPPDDKEWVYSFRCASDAIFFDLPF